MTNYENKRKEVLQQWAGLEMEKDAKIRELWEINWKLEKIKNLIKKYGLDENSSMGEKPAELG